MRRGFVAVLVLVACGRRGFEDPQDARVADAADAMIDVSAGGMLVLRPTGPGTFTEWNITSPAGAEHWDMVDEPDPADDTLTQTRTNTAGLRDTFVHAPSGLQPARTIERIEVTARAWSPQGWMIELIVRSGGVESPSPAIALTDTWTKYSHVWLVDPATNAPWTVAAVDALEIGAHAVTASAFFEPSITQMWLTVVYR